MVIKILEMALPVLIMLGLGYFAKQKMCLMKKGLLGLKAFISNITRRWYYSMHFCVQSTMRKL